MNTQVVSRVVPIRGQGVEEHASVFEAVLISASRPLTLDHLTSVAGIDKARAVMLLRQYQGRRKDTNPWVFQSQFRRRMSKESIERHIRNLGERAGIRRRVTPHRLRHSFARHLREAGMPMDVIQALMGHEDMRTTQRYSGLPTQEIGQYYRALFP